MLRINRVISGYATQVDAPIGVDFYISLGDKMTQLVFQAALAGLILSGIYHFVDRKSNCPKTTIYSLIGRSQGFSFLLQR